ncbi:MAG: hypothetical protein ISS92_06465 [Candidatus Omnitrophica bacterium]|nr:hypothetical protein [Candidatus Omnitrophota bacterium]
MARDNYSYRKYQKELTKKKKREAKRQRKLDKKNPQPQEGEVPPVISEVDKNETENQKEN